jgi:hypothetical protein
LLLLIALDARSTEDQLAGPLQEYRDVRAEIAQNNRLIATISELSTGRVVWSDLVAEILTMMPAGATIQTLHIDGQNNTFTFSGTAPTRGALVEFEERLRQLSWAGEIDAPRDNLLKAVGPSYRFTIHVNLPAATGQEDDASPAPQS